MIASPRRCLLDVNLVLALLDPQHMFHEAAHLWAASEPESRWLTCPLVQNGVLRVVAHSASPNPIGTVSDVRAVLAAFCSADRHQFIADDISLLNDDVIT